MSRPAGFRPNGMARAHIGRRAVVVGAGMGGLAAGGALADFFEQVVVVERDSLPADAAHRAGTPQARHVHALLSGGERALEELFPGFGRELASGGAVLLRVSLDFRSGFPGFDPYPQRDLGIVTRSMSRPLIEAIARRRIRELPNIAVRERCRVRRVIASNDGGAVTGVGLENADGDSETLSADLIVDASGRGNLTDSLLEQIASPRPVESAIGVDVGYATSLFAIPDDAPAGWKALLTMPEQGPGRSRGALMMPIEGRRWMVTLAGRYEQSRRATATASWNSRGGCERRLCSTRSRGPLASAMSSATASQRASGGITSSCRGFPRGLLPFGDAICRFNPIWGQGMTVAAQEALLLRRLLGGDAGDPLGGLAPEFFAAAVKVIETPWMQAAIPDFAEPQTEGQRPSDLEQRLNFGGALQRLAAQDPEIHRLVVEVRHLLKPGSALRDPALMARVAAMMAEA
jgi:2-polyprenyl-6-methoxyphenol hydroxylase-like FAD-dependent oxidoreductase